MGNERFVAMLDILGFSEVVRNVEPTRLEEIISELKSSMRLLHWEDNISHGIIESLMLSDTIIVWTIDDTALSLQHLVSVVSGVIFNAFSFDNLALRGAISVGEAYIFPDDQVSPTLMWNKMVLGKAVIDAHEHEKCQEWAGCVISNEALDRARKNSSNAHFPMKKWEKSNFVEYDVPIKKKCTQQHYAMNWMRTYFEGDDPQLKGITDDEIREKFTSYNRDIIRVKDKFENTLKFIRYVESTRY